MLLRCIDQVTDYLLCITIIVVIDLRSNKQTSKYTAEAWGKWTTAVGGSISTFKPTLSAQLERVLNSPLKGIFLLFVISQSVPATVIATAMTVAWTR